MYLLNNLIVAEYYNAGTGIFELNLTAHDCVFGLILTVHIKVSHNWGVNNLKRKSISVFYFNLIQIQSKDFKTFMTSWVKKHIFPHII